MREKLPCVFRINPSNTFYKQYKQILNESNFIMKFQKEEESNNYNDNNQIEDSPKITKIKPEEKMLIESIKIKPFNLCNTPKLHNMIYNINIPRFDLKRNNSLANFHNFVQKSVASGLISRQEAVSMIPPILTEVMPGEIIFDTCAAPGSKTAQLLEEFYRDFNFFDTKSIINDKGVILANDNNPKRAYMMCFQLKRLNTAGMMIISHDAQHFPTIIKSNGEKFLFDKILCDVPCSSDAVMRKLPQKWKTWSPKDSFSLHRLQLQIVKRAVNLLKEGGRLVYSTCSLNPIEVIFLYFYLSSFLFFLIFYFRMKL
jgi:16S rRNA C967 or C1407 C5-methylase (RsmB/RsmF family)